MQLLEVYRGLLDNYSTIAYTSISQYCWIHYVGVSIWLVCSIHRSPQASQDDPWSPSPGASGPEADHPSGPVLIRENEYPKDGSDGYEEKY